MLYTGKEIVSKIKGHIRRRGNSFPSWVVGLSKDAREDLSKRHHVQQKVDRWILMHATSPTVARKVKDFLAQKLGVMAHKGREDEAADFVYAYQRSPTTKP